MAGVGEAGEFEFASHLLKRFVIGEIVRPGALAAGGEGDAEASEGFVEGAWCDWGKAIVVDKEEEIGGEGVAVAGDAAKALEEVGWITVAGKCIEEPSLDASAGVCAAAGGEEDGVGDGRGP